MNKSIRIGGRITAAIFILACVSMGASCSLFHGGPDPVSGKWEGHWYVGNSEKAAGGLNCTIEPGEKRGEFKAMFDAEFGQRATYQVALKGARRTPWYRILWWREDKVVFEGEEDLGTASGGVFAWKGQADGQEFKGSYTSKLVSGTFKMTKAE